MNKLVKQRFKIEQLEARIQQMHRPCRCRKCGEISIEEKAYRFLKKVAKLYPNSPHASANFVARNLGVSYRTALAACMKHPKIAMEAWRVKSPHYVCREFTAL